jgi:hypothetical protein
MRRPVLGMQCVDETDVLHEGTSLTAQPGVPIDAPAPLVRTMTSFCAQRGQLIIFGHGRGACRQRNRHSNATPNGGIDEEQGTCQCRDIHELDLAVVEMDPVADRSVRPVTGLRQWSPTPISARLPRPEPSMIAGSGIDTSIHPSGLSCIHTDINVTPGHPGLPQMVLKY